MLEVSGVDENAGWSRWQALIAETPKCRLLRLWRKVMLSVAEDFSPFIKGLFECYWALVDT